jgi:hypothetical protein
MGGARSEAIDRLGLCLRLETKSVDLGLIDACV